MRDLLLSLPESEQKEILLQAELLEHFPHMSPVRIKGRRFRRHRWFPAGNWLVFYRVADNCAHIRGLWPLAFLNSSEHRDKSGRPVK